MRSIRRPSLSAVAIATGIPPLDTKFKPGRFTLAREQAAAVDDERRPGDEVSLHEEGDGVRDVRGRADATEEGLAGAPIFLPGFHRHRPRGDPADADLGRE